MYTTIVSLLNHNELERISAVLTNGNFKSGKLTASGAAQQVKNNQQLPHEDEAASEINHIIAQALNQSPMFREATQAKYLLPFSISRYTSGMEYGWHVDSPLMSGSNGHLIRADLSITIFLSEPGGYEAGELEIETEAGTQLFKLNKGDAIIYPTTRLHRVRQVTGGARHVAVSWLQSLVKDSAQRDLLFQLKSLQEGLAQQQQGSNFHLLSQQIHSNLLRMLSEV